MPDRTIDWGGPNDPGTTYQTGDDDPAGGGNFVVARDIDGGVTLLEYDATAGEWVSRGDVNLNGNDLSANAIDAASVSAETLLGADVANSAENQILVAQGDGTLAVETQAQGPNPYDQAQSFQETDVSVSTTETQVSNGSISLSGEISSTVSREADNDVRNLSRSEGLVINPNSDLIQLDATLSTNTGVAQSVVVTDSSENIIDEKNGSFTAGDTVSLTGTFNSGTDYYIGVWNEGDDLDIGEREGSNFPYTSSQLDIIDGGVGFHPDDGFGINTPGFALGISSIKAYNRFSATTGSATIEWGGGIPTDIFEWDIATFTRTLDGETVDVFVAYSGDGGSTWTRTNGGNPISRNYSLRNDTNITSNVDVRVEAELSRANTANNPTLDSAYRSWLV